jgi:protein-L-isoaspartate O-methyltransferase
MGDVIDPDVAAHYALGLEDARLVAGGLHRLEFVRTLELLHRSLPLPPGRVLDVGGGTGVYAAPLCDLGYSVHVIEPIDLHVQHVRELARGHQQRLTAELGDARVLCSAGGDYDAVLMLGPLYHLTDAED